MIAIDSSVAIAGFAPWHERHGEAQELLAERPRLVAHAALETYSVLTRLAPPFRAPARVAAEFLERRFPDPSLTLDEGIQQQMFARVLALEIEGGAVYDALIAFTAAAARASLITLDNRALATYTRCGVEARLLG